MRETNDHLIPDRSRPRSTTAVTNICVPRGVGEHATWANRRRRGRRQSRARKEKHVNRKKVTRVEGWHPKCGNDDGQEQRTSRCDGKKEGGCVVCPENSMERREGLMYR